MTTSPGPSARLLTCADVAAQLGVTPHWVRSEARAGRIDHRKIGRNYRFTEADVHTLIERAHHVGHDPLALSARQVAAMNRPRRARGETSGPAGSSS